MENLTQKKCQVCEGGVPALGTKDVQRLLEQLNDWDVIDDKTLIKTFNFKGFNKTMGFVNAVAWIANQEGHHPDMSISFNRCVVHFTTHAIGGLTENDFICAAKVDALLA